MLWNPISNLYNWVLKDPVLDWLEIYGQERGFAKDIDLPTYLAAADYGLFVKERATRFEERLLALIRARLDVATVEGSRSNDNAFFEQTLRLINEGQEAIYQGLVRDPDLEVFGVPDLILRGSAIEKLVPGTIGELDPSDYFVLDIKFKGLELNKRGDLKSSHAWERVQLALYERALATMLGRNPNKAFALGRRLAGDERQGGGCFDVIPWIGPLDDKGLANVGDGLAWLSDLKEQGASWDLDPPSDPRLVPNSKNTQDSPWHDAKKQILETRPRAPWEGPPVQPERIAANRNEWFEPKRVEFYVDFETFNGMNDDLSSLPQAGGRPMIFMIGCGHEEHGEWKFSVWTAASETCEAEVQIIEAWTAHMEAVRRRIAPDLVDPLVFHWHSHEVNELRKAAERHEELSSFQLNWFDLLWRVFKEEPIRIIETNSQSLKPVARKFHDHGFIKTLWPESAVADGLAAMTAAWSCYAEARERGVLIGEVLDGLMAEIEAYNQVDCKAMWEILRHLRANH